MAEGSEEPLWCYGMDNLADRQRIGGESVQISDCRVWAEINYLDSPTNYCECLPQHCARQSNIRGHDMVMLESYAPLRSSKARRWLPWLVVLFIIVISWFLPRFLEAW
jgi:hypothetical protein